MLGNGMVYMWTVIVNWISFLFSPCFWSTTSWDWAMGVSILPSRFVFKFAGLLELRFGFSLCCSFACYRSFWDFPELAGVFCLMRVSVRTGICYYLICP